MEHFNIILPSMPGLHSGVFFSDFLAWVLYHLFLVTG